ncbi:hypothetical protein BGZ75_001251 [Mortierella antarctica]|nr:hypothetical protein BGZ75_001251 [Mortierella antarctica]
MTLPEAVETPEEIAIRRAEQNRAAQRAFRQRKQKYIKWLESKAEELDEVYRIMSLVRAENKQLCHLVAELEERLSADKGSCSSMSASPLSTRSGSSAERGAKVTGDTGAIYGSRGSTTPGTFEIDGSLGREISMRLMNLAMLPNLGGLDSLGQDAALMSRSRSLSSLHDSSNKMIHHTKQQGPLPQAALQPSQLLFSQHHDRYHNNQQQHLFSAGDMADKPGNQQISHENGGSWASYSPSSTSASSTSMLVLNISTPLPDNPCLPHVPAAASELLSPQSNHDDSPPSASVAHDYSTDAAQRHQQIQSLPHSNELNSIAQNNSIISPLVSTQQPNIAAAYPTGSNATSPIQTTHTIQARNKQFFTHHHPYAYTTFNNHHQHPVQPLRGAQPHNPQSSPSMDSHLQQQIGALKWEDDDGTDFGTARGRRSSMPILHISMPFSSAGAYDPNALTTGDPRLSNAIVHIGHQGMLQNEVQFRLQQQQQGQQQQQQQQQHQFQQQQQQHCQLKQEQYEVPLSVLDPHLAQGHSNSLKQLSIEQQQQQQQQHVIYGL